MTEQPIRVFLVDDHSIVRCGMRAFLGVLGDIVVVGEAKDGQDAVDQLAAAANDDDLPDVVLMDVLMPRLDGIAATKVIKERFPQVEVVILTTFSEAERVHTALEAGAAGYLLKDAGPIRSAGPSARHTGARSTWIRPWHARSRDR